MRHIFFCFTLLAAASLIIACGQQVSSNDDSPTGAYTRLYAAVKSKNPEAIKAVMTKKTLEFAKMAGAQQNKSIEQVIENGFTATTFSEKLPDIRDQRIDGDMGAI